VRSLFKCRRTATTYIEVMIIQYKNVHGIYLLCASIIIIIIIIIIILHDSIFPGLNDLLNGFNGHKDSV